MKPIAIQEEMGFRAVNSFSTANEFSQYIELSAAEAGTDVLDVLLKYLDETGIEETKIKPLISKSLENKLFECYVDRGLIRGERNSLSEFL